MLTQQVYGSWNEQKKKLKERFSKLTDADFRFEKGKQTEMLERLQIKLGKTKQQLHNLIGGL